MMKYLLLKKVLHGNYYKEYRIYITGSKKEIGFLTYYRGVLFPH